MSSNSDGTSANDIFVQEATEILEQLETLLIELESDATKDLVDQIFRSMHTIKGSGDMFGFTALASFTHAFETAFDNVRNQRVAVTPDLIDVSLRARDHMTKLLTDGRANAANAGLQDDSTGVALLKQLEAAVGGQDTAPDQTGQNLTTAPGSGEAGEQQRLYRITFSPPANVFKNGARPESLTAELAQFGALQYRLCAERTPALEDMDAQDCTCTWHIRLQTTEPPDALRDVFIFFDESDIEMIEEPVAPAPDAVDAQPEQSKHAKPDTPQETPPATQNDAPAGATADRSAGGATGSVRVQSYRLDELMDQLGELVIAQARLDQVSAMISDPTLSSIAEEIERLVTGLRDSTLSIRMLPIEGAFGRFRRVVRQLSNELGKEVDLVTEGGETELDKNVIDSLSEPLVHMIRNAIDHGLETADERIAAGKPRRGYVKLSARQAGGEVLISIQDDGRGINTERVRARALQAGMIAEGDELSDDDLNQLIFQPGFSTAPKLTSVSGRGVGMDAVQRAISDLRGSVHLRSDIGQGATVTLRLPMTLAIIDGLLVRVGGGCFVIPLASVNECVELNPQDNASSSGRTLMRIRDDLVPFLDLNAFFGSEPTFGNHRRVVVVNAEEKRVGLVVDDVLGQHQTVIKSLSAFHRDVEGLSGGTILGDGTVALILDAPALIKAASRSEHRQAA